MLNIYILNITNRLFYTVYIDYFKKTLISSFDLVVDTCFLKDQYIKPELHEKQVADVNSALECQHICQDHGECRSFVYYPLFMMKSCYLVTQFVINETDFFIPKERKKEFYAGGITGPKNCSGKSNLNINVYFLLKSFSIHESISIIVIGKGL